VHEALISQVRIDQQGAVRVDAFPNKTWPGRVKEIAATASPDDWLAADVKVYPVQVALQGEAPELRPGMSAEVRIEVGQVIGVVHVPVQAVVRAGPGHFCYVKMGQEIHKRAVVPGLRSETMVEIRGGVKEGESVLR